MYTSARIRRFIRGIKLGQLFTTRQCLSFGSRGAVDQALYVLVNLGFIIRVARGVFRRHGSLPPTLLAVATIKAKSFGKRIYAHGADVAAVLGFPAPANTGPTFACTGRSSAFRCGDKVIRFIGTSPRKLHKRNSLAGKVIGALWHLGKQRATTEAVSQTYPLWSKVQEDIKAAAQFLPAWMNNLFYWGKKESRFGRHYSFTPSSSIDWAALFPEHKDLFAEG